MHEMYYNAQICFHVLPGNLQEITNTNQNMEQKEEKKTKHAHHIHTNVHKHTFYFIVSKACIYLTILGKTSLFLT